MLVKHYDDGKEGMFYIEKEGKLVAKMTYHWQTEDRFVITHTEVSDELRGMGAGKQLVSKSVDFAREKGVKIVPLCSFAKSVFEKIEAFRDVL